MAKKIFKIGNSEFQISGMWKIIHNNKGDLIGSIRLDKTDKSIIISQYIDESLFLRDSKNAVNTQTIMDIQCKLLNNYPAIVFFKKNNKYFSITVNNLDSRGKWKDIIAVDDEATGYIEEIIGSIQ